LNNTKLGWDLIWILKWELIGSLSKKKKEISKKREKTSMRYLESPCSDIGNHSVRDEYIVPKKTAFISRLMTT